MNLLEKAREHQLEVNKAMAELEYAKKSFDEMQNTGYGFYVKASGEELDIHEWDDTVNELYESIVLSITTRRNNALRLAEERLTLLIGEELPCVDVTLPPQTSETGKVEEVDTNDEIELKIENTASEDITLTQPVSEQPMGKPKLDCSYDNLYKLYIAEGKTVKELVAEYDVTTPALYKELGKHGLVDLKKTMRKDAKVTPSKGK